MTAKSSTNLMSLQENVNLQISFVRYYRLRGECHLLAKWKQKRVKVMYHTDWIISICNKNNTNLLHTKLLNSVVYLLLTYGTNTHEACSSDPIYLITRNPFALLFGHEWTNKATVHSSSHQAMTQASDQLHTTCFCSPPVLSNIRNTRDTRDTQNAWLLLLLVMCRP